MPQETKSKEEIEEILSLVSYPGFEFVCKEKRSDPSGYIDLPSNALYLQIECDDVCNVTNKPMKWKSRKWLLSAHATKSEIVQTAFLAVLTALEHEAREKFMYEGVSVFDGHYDVDALKMLRQQDNCLDVRKE